MKTQEKFPLYGGNPIAFSLKPVKLAKETYNNIQSSLTKLLKQLEEFTTMALTGRDKKLLDSLGVTLDFDAVPTPLGLHIPFARFDFFLKEDGEIQVLELNTDGTSSWNVAEWVGRQAAVPESQDPNFNLSLRLLDGIRAHAPKAPKVFLCDFPDVLTKWEQDDLVERWSKVVPAARCEPDQRSWDAGDVIYRRAVSWALRERWANAEPFLKDWREKKIIVVGGWSSDVGMSKAWPAFVKTSLCPETIIVDDSVRKSLKENKNQWVLKSLFSHSGRGITRGVDVLDPIWAERLRGSGKLVAQKLVQLPHGEVLEWGMFFINGKPSGLMARSGQKGAITDNSEDVMRPVQIEL